MAQNFSGGLAGSTRDGGFASANNAAARAAANAAVDRALGTNFSAGNTPGGRSGGGSNLIGGAGRQGGGGTGVMQDYTASYSPSLGGNAGGILGGSAMPRISPASNSVPVRSPVVFDPQFRMAALSAGLQNIANRYNTGAIDFNQALNALAPYQGAYGISGTSDQEIKDYLAANPGSKQIGEFGTSAYDIKSAVDSGLITDKDIVDRVNSEYNDAFGWVPVSATAFQNNLAPLATKNLPSQADIDAAYSRGLLGGGPVASAKPVTDRIAPSDVSPDVVSPIEGSTVYRSQQQIPTDVVQSGGMSIPGGYRGITGPNGELRIQPTSYGTNYQTAQALRSAYPEQFGQYSTTDVADTLETFSKAIPGEAGSRMFGTDAMNNIARVGLNQIVGGYSPSKMLRGMDTTGMRPATRGFEQPGANSAGMTDNWANQQSGNAYRSLAANAIREAMMGQGVSPQAMNASNFVAAGTPMVRGVNTVGAPIQGTQFGSDPNWGTRIADRNQVALGLLGGGASGTYAGSPDVVAPAQAASSPATQVQGANAPASTGQLVGGDWTQAMRSPPAPIETPIQDAIGGLLGSYYGVGYDGYPNRQSVRQGWETIPSEPTPYSPAPEDASLMEKFANVFKPGNLFPYAKDVNAIEGTPEGRYIQQTETGPLKGYLDVPYRYEAMDKPVYGAPGVPDGWTAPIKGASVITFKDGGGIWKHPTQGWEPISQFRGDLSQAYKGESNSAQAKKEAAAAARLNADEGSTTGSTDTANSSMLPQWYLDWLQSSGQYGGLLA